jgi:ADP-ribose pyrophosphatase
MVKKSKKPWSTQSRQYLCKTPFLAVRRDTIVYPGGRVGPYYVVERGDFAIIIPYFSNGDTILVRQHRYPLGIMTWEFPMGRVSGVSIKQMAQTELRQETGFAARQLTRLGAYHVGPGMMDQRAHIFLAEKLYVKPEPPDDGESITMQRLPMKRVAQWFKTGKITDGPSILAWQALQNYGR